LSSSVDTFIILSELDLKVLLSIGHVVFVHIVVNIVLALARETNLFRDTEIRHPCSVVQFRL